MTVDREQAKKDAERAVIGAHGNSQAYKLAIHVTLLLAELEQAERERDEALTAVKSLTRVVYDAKPVMQAAQELAHHFKGKSQHITVRNAADAYSAFAKSCYVAAEAQLAKVPALVEALRQIAENYYTAGKAREALAAYEQEQKP